MINDPFGPVPLKREGAIADPDAFTWECDLNVCEKCRQHYLSWKQQYLEQEEKWRQRCLERTNKETGV